MLSPQLLALVSHYRKYVSGKEREILIAALFDVNTISVSSIALIGNMITALTESKYYFVEQF